MQPMPPPRFFLKVWSWFVRSSPLRRLVLGVARLNLIVRNIMYRVPVDLDLSVLIGTELNLIGLGRYEVRFSFNGQTTIHLQSRATLLQNGIEIATWDEEKNWSSLSFQQLLNQAVLGYLVPDNQLLEIQFTDSFLLRLHENSDHYESIQIYFAGASEPAIII